jgi:hypothetical protein
MKIRMAMPIAFIMSCSTAFAASYDAECNVPACIPFGPGNSYVLQLAASAASAASIGDDVVVYRYNIQGCEVRGFQYEVVDVPVLNGSDLNFTNYICLD